MSCLVSFLVSCLVSCFLSCLVLSCFVLFVLSVLVLCLVLSCFVLPRVEWSGSEVGRVRDSGKNVGACVDEKKNDDRNHNRVSAGNSSSRRHTPPYSSHSLTLRTVPNSSHQSC